MIPDKTILTGLCEAAKCRGKFRSWQIFGLLTYKDCGSMRLTAAIDKASNYLLRHRGWTGLWWDFFTYAGYSDEWLSAFVASVLAKLPQQKFSHAVRLTWDRLVARHPTRAGWGYSEYAPQDADSTIWVLNLAQILGKHDPEVHEAYKFLLDHCRPDGGVATYNSSFALRRFLRVDSATSFVAWCSSHTDVTASAANHHAFPKSETALEYLRQNQHLDGSWRGYWWCDPEYTSALAVKALSKTGKTEDRRRVQSTIQWAIQRLGITGIVETSLRPTGSIFATALAVQILELEQETPTVYEVMKKSVSWLLSKQTPAGYWHSAATLRLPHPADLNPDHYKNWNRNGTGNIGDIVFDVRKLFTTATVLETLIEVRSLSREFDDE